MTRKIFKIANFRFILCPLYINNKMLYEKELFLYNFDMERIRAKLLGFNIDTFDFEGAVNYVRNLFTEQKGAHIVTINPEMIDYGTKNEVFAEIIKKAELVIPDGIGVKLGLKIKGINVQRIAGIEFSRKLIELCAENKYTVGLVGAKPHVIEKTAENLKNEIKDLNIVYKQDGYFKDEEKVLTELKENSPKFLLVALGYPKQEEFIDKARKYLPNSIMIGVGGSFDVWAGEVERAPEIWQKLCLEWLYRTIKQPQRVKRIFPTLPLFVLKVVMSKED